MPIDKRDSYQTELRARVMNFLEGEDFAGPPPRDEDVEELYTFVKGIALESYKNGLAVGKRRSSTRLDETRRSGKVKE